MYKRIIITGLIGVFMISGLMPVERLDQTPVDTRQSRQSQALQPVVSTFFAPSDALARRGFRGIRSSRSLWNRRSRSSVFSSRTTRNTQAPKRTPSTSTPGRTTNRSSGVSASNARSTGVGSRSGTAVARRSAMASRLNQANAKQALDNHRSRQSTFARPSTTAANTSEYKNNPIYKRGSNDRVSYDRYYDRRDSYYRGYGWNAPPYVFMGSPSFGMWDALIWWSILDNLSDRHRYSMAYHHAGDPGYRAWRKEAEELAADNAELRQKLNKLDRQVATLEGTPVDPDYLPPGITPEIALAAEVTATADPGPPKLTIGTGVQSGNYHRFGTFMQKHLPDFEVTLMPSNGSVENLDNFTSDACDAILVQSDMLNAYLRDNPDASDQLIGLQSTLYTEFVQLLVNENSGITGITNLDPKIHTIYVGPHGSGTHGAWRGFVLQDPAYGEFNTRHSSYEEALRQVAENTDAVMIFVSGLNSEVLRQANDEYGNRVNLVAVQDEQFTTAIDQFGNSIYETAVIPHETYPNIQDGWIFGWFGDSSVSTLKVEAVLILSQHWVDTYGSLPMTVVEDAVWRAIDEIEPIVGE